MVDVGWRLGFCARTLGVGLRRAVVLRCDDVCSVVCLVMMMMMMAKDGEL